MSNSPRKSYASHWSIDAESAEYLLMRLGGLREKVGDIYDGPTRAGLEELNQRLKQLSNSLSEESEEVRRQVKEVIEYTGRFKSLTANRFLELQAEVKMILDRFEDVKKVTEKEAEYKARLISLERWKLIATVIVAFLGGLVFPVLLYLLGVSPP